MEGIESNLVYEELKRRESDFIPKINGVYKYVHDILQKINSVFDNYTEHGIDHSLRVLGYMSHLIKDVSGLSDLELTVIIYAALFHDVGMLVEDEELNATKTSGINEYGMKYNTILQSFKNDEKLALQEYYRPVHGIRAKHHILNMKNMDLFCIPMTNDTSFAEVLGDICNSHTQSIDWLQSKLKRHTVKGDYNLNPQFIAVLLRLGDILDIDEQRTPLYVYKLFQLNNYGNLEWRQHFVIDNTKKIFTNSITGQKYVELHGTSDDAEVHRKILSYIDWINQELQASSIICEDFPEDKHQLFIKGKVVNRIETKGFRISDFRLTLNYKAVTRLLMGEKIYGDKRYGLRELVQNSIDACKLMSEIHKPIELKTGDPYNPYIYIIIDKDDGKVKIRDNGIGMSIDTLRKYFLNVGVSYYSSDEFKYRGYDYKPIGNFGIGFLSCFMLSDKVTVSTKHYSENQSNEVDLQKSSEYISLSYRDDAKHHGTEVALDYNSFMAIFRNDISKVKTFIEDNFLISDIDVKILEIGSSNTNQTNCKASPDMSCDTITLDKYLNGIDTQLVLKTIEDDIEKLEEITGGDSSEIFIYNDETGKLEKCKDISLNLFIEEDDKISYLQIPLIEGDTAVRFENLINALEDWEEAFSKIKDELTNYIYIFAEECSMTSHAFGKTNYNDNLIGNYSFDEFCNEFGTEKYNGTSVEEVSICVSHKDTLESVLLIDEKVKLGYDYSKYYDWYYVRGEKEITQKIYNKSVYLSKVQLNIPYLADMINIGKITIDLHHNHVIPNLARDDIESDLILKEISYAVGKAIHCYVLEHCTIKNEQEELLKVFIEKYYKDDNTFFSSHKCEKL